MRTGMFAQATLSLPSPLPKGEGISARRDAGASTLGLRSQNPVATARGTDLIANADRSLSASYKPPTQATNSLNPAPNRHSSSQRLKSLLVKQAPGSSFGRKD